MLSKLTGRSGETGVADTVPVQSDTFRRFFAGIPTATATLIYKFRDGICAITVSSVVSVSAAPPSLGVLINREGRSLSRILGSGWYGLSYVGRSLISKAAHYAVPGGSKRVPPAEVIGEGDPLVPTLAAAAHRCTVKVDKTLPVTRTNS